MPAAVAFMIDAPRTRDRDDALAVQPTTQGWAATVHITDVARHVPVGSPADVKARAQGATVYLPDERTRPMLPSIEEQATLTPGRDNHTLRIHLSIDATGEVSTTAIEPGVLTDPVKVSYAQADALLAADSCTALHDANAAAQAMLTRRRAHGALAVYDLLRGWETSEEGTIRRLRPWEAHASHIIVQEFMIAANAAVARYAATADLSLLYRNHAASSVAPDRARLAEDLAAAAAHPEQVNTDTLTERLHLVLRAATYAPTLGGHFGLNLGSYTHSTSPLRRYADLVNQRIMLAHLGGQPSPYTAADLTGLAEHINTLDTERRERRAARFKEASKRAMRQQLDTAAFTRLDEDGFYRAIKAAVSENRYSEQFEHEVLSRLSSGRLASRDLSYLLLRSAGESWTVVRTAALGWLADHPEHAVSLLAAHAVTQGWPAPVYTEHREGPPHRPVFTVAAQVTTKDAGKVSAAPRKASGKKQAAQQAAVSLLAALTGLADPSADSAESPSPAAAPAAAVVIKAGNPVGALNELTQKGLLGAVTYRSTVTGSAHAPVFTFTASASVHGELVEGVGEGSAKALSKAASAADLLGKVRPALGI